MGERSKAVSRALRIVANAWAWGKAELEDDRGRAGNAPRGWADPAAAALGGRTAKRWRPRPDPMKVRDAR